MIIVLYLLYYIRMSENIKGGFLELMEEFDENDKLKKKNKIVKEQNKKEKLLLFREKYREKKNALQKYKYSLNPQGKIEEIIPENPTDDYIKYKGTHKNRKVIILKCDNCKLKFERTLSELNRKNKRNCKHIFCNKKCFNSFEKEIRCEMVSLICAFCKTNFKLRKNVYDNESKRNNKNFYCNKFCYANSLKVETIKVNCNYCGSNLERLPYRLRTSGIYYCNNECLKNAPGISRSQLEIYLEKQLNKYFPYLKYIPNDRTECNGLELDFYFPDLRIGIEINGIFHYDSKIRGEKVLNKIQKHDKLKSKICKQKQIDLFIIKSIEDFKDDEIKEREWKYFKNTLISKIPYCETEENCIFDINYILKSNNIKENFEETEFYKDAISNYILDEIKIFDKLDYLDKDTINILEILKWE